MILGKHLVHITLTYIDETLLYPDVHRKDTLQAVWDCALVSESRSWERWGVPPVCVESNARGQGLNSIHFNPFCQIYSSTINID